MPIAQLPAFSEVQKKIKRTNWAEEITWQRGVAAGSLITGAILLATGKRKAGITLTAVGAAAALLEDVEGTRDLWNSIPQYIESGQQVLGKFEKFVEELAEQGERVSKMISKQMR